MTGIVMANIDFLKKQIKKMNVKSDEFFELYKLVSDKYWTFKDPDDFQVAAMTLRRYTERSTNNYEEQVIAVVKIITELFRMEHNKTTACMGTVGFKEKEYHFTITTDQKHLDEMADILKLAAKGKFTVKNKGKK